MNTNLETHTRRLETEKRVDMMGMWLWNNWGFLWKEDQLQWSKLWKGPRKRGRSQSVQELVVGMMPLELQPEENQPQTSKIDRRKFHCNFFYIVSCFKLKVHFQQYGLSLAESKCWGSFTKTSYVETAREKEKFMQPTMGCAPEKENPPTPP